MRRARRQHARRGIRRKADDDDRIAGMEGAEIEILGPGAADQLHVVGPEQAKLIVEQLRDAAAAAKAGDPDPLRRHAAPCAASAIEPAEMRARPAASASSLSATSDDVGVGTAGAALGAAGERRGLRRPARFGQRRAQFVPAGIAQGLGQPREGSGIGARHGGQIAHRTRGGVIIIGGDEAPDLLQPRRQRRQCTAELVQRRRFRLRLSHETYVAQIAVWCNI